MDKSTARLFEALLVAEFGSISVKVSNTVHINQGGTIHRVLFNEHTSMVDVSSHYIYTGRARQHAP